MDQYDNGPTTRSISKHTNLKTCYDHNEEHISRSYLHNKCIGLGKNELSHVTYQIYQNNDFSSMNDTKIICDEVYYLFNLFYLLIFQFSFTLFHKTFIFCLFSKYLTIILEHGNSHNKIFHLCH